VLMKLLLLLLLWRWWWWGLDCCQVCVGQQRRATQPRDDEVGKKINLRSIYSRNDDDDSKRIMDAPTISQTYMTAAIEKKKRWDECVVAFINMGEEVRRETSTANPLRASTHSMV